MARRVVRPLTSDPIFIVLSVILICLVAAQLIAISYHDDLDEKTNQNTVFGTAITIRVNNNTNVSMRIRKRAIAGRERTLDILQQAGVNVSNIDTSLILQLPKWEEEVAPLYGEDVVIYGMEDCERFRNSVPKREAVLGVAGLFNTGTNLLEKHFHMNILEVQTAWQVPWGKHRMAENKWTNTAEGFEGYNKSYVLPVVMIRDPLNFFQSMCRHPYAARWRHNNNHCPNFVPNDADRISLHMRKGVEVFGADIKYNKTNKYHFTSLVHMWNDWYNQYLEADYPVLIIRYEDVIFQTEKVLQRVAACVSGSVRHPLKHQLNTSKSHGSGTDFVKAIIKTGDSSGRLNNMTSDDLEFARKHLDSNLMKTFHYRLP